MNLRHTTKNQKTRYYELDALRGIAAVSVMLFHFTINTNKTLLGWEFRFGVTGVDLFFMISGFVILLSASKTSTAGRFVRSRYVRLYPAFWLCALLTFLVKQTIEPLSTSTNELLANATMVPIFFGHEYLDGSYWTLVIELTFYLGVAALLFSGWIGQIEEVGLSCIAAIVLLHSNAGFYPGFYHFITNKVQIINHFPLFFSGIVCYRIKSLGWTFRRSSYLIISMAASIYLHDKGGPAHHFVSLREHSVLIISFHILFILFIHGQLQFLKQRVLIFCGEISYCLYLIHQYVGLKIMDALAGAGQFNMYVALIVTVSICIFSAWLITTCIELPVIGYLRSKRQQARVKPAYIINTVAIDTRTTESIIERKTSSEDCSSSALRKAANTVTLAATGNSGTSINILKSSSSRSFATSDAPNAITARIKAAAIVRKPSSFAK
ncbi:acyltransferase family protein [Dyadobacter linearis]|uniref:acyltransferase family protein n=1 Tax=Dyadobacter linearis TaxID=2823330 RepID=UPI001BFC03D9|nr:acyltransferase [Dyadobacter sp. CECT 9623]